MKKLTKLLVLALFVAIVFTGVIVAVSADSSSGNEAAVGSTEYATVKAALDAAPAGSTVKLLTDVNLSDYYLNKNLKLDLNGHSITSDGGTSKYMFGLGANVSFEIVGDGELNIDGSLTRTTNAGINFSVTGGFKGIKINHTGKVNNNVLRVTHGTWSFTNVDIKAIPNKDFAFHINDAGDATFNFKATSIDTTATTNLEENSGVFYICKLGKLNIDGCRIDTNGSFIQFESDSSATTATAVTTDKYVVINDSQIRAINKTTQVCLFGAYLPINANIYVTNSYLESTFRCANVNHMGKGALILDNSTLVANNDDRNCQFMRDGAIRVKGNSSIALIKNTSKTVGFAAVPTNSVIYLEEGARINHAAFVALTELKASGTYYVEKNVSSVKFVEHDSDGNEVYVPFYESQKYTFVYDPLGNPDAPYVVTEIGEGAVALFTKDESGNITSSTVNVSDHPSVADYDWLYRDGGSYAGVFNNKGTVTNEDGTTSTGSITLGATYIDGNAVFQYRPNGVIYQDASTGAKKGVNIWIGYAKGISETTMDLFIYEFDFAAGSADGFATGYVGLNARTTADGGSGLQSQFFKVAKDGTLTASATLKDFPGYKLKTNGWNKISVIVDTSVEKGCAYVFIDGNYIGYSTAYQKDEAFIYAPRFDSSITDASVIGPANYFDNVSIRMIGDGTGTAIVEGVTDAAEYITNGGKPYAEGNTFHPESPAITVGGVGYESIDDAAEVANKLGVPVQINANVTEPQTVSKACTVITNGYTVAFAEDSISCVPVTDESGTVIGYTFSIVYDGEITVHWSVGNILTGEYEDVTTVVKTGFTPTYPLNEHILIYNDTQRVVYRQTGWEGVDTENPLSYEYVQEIMNGEAQGHVYATPIVAVNPVAQVLTDANGELVSATDNTGIDANSPLYKLKAGYTYQLLADCVMTEALGSKSMTMKTGTYNIDLNGHTMRIAHNGVSFTIGANTTLNVYSSAPGGAITKIGKADGTKVRGNTLFNLSAINDTNAKIEENVLGNIHNAVLNVKGVTLTGDCVIEPRAGDESCSVNIEDTTLIRVGNAYDALVYPRYYNGKVNIKNSTLINNTTGWILADPSTHVELVDFSYSTTTVIDGCTVITMNEDQGFIGATLSHDKITVKNTVINGRLYETRKYVDPAKIEVGENVAVTVKPDNYSAAVWAKWGGSFGTEGLASLKNGELFSAKKSVIVNSAVAEIDLYFAVRGSDISAIPSGAEIRYLEPLLYMTLAGKDTVSVTWENLDGEAALTETYIKGGKVFDAGVTLTESDKDLVAMKKVFTSWGTLPENLAKDETVAPVYDIKHNITGLQHNLSLYSDLYINLFIPAAYKNNIKVYRDEARTQLITLNNVTAEGQSYVSAVIGKAAMRAAEPVIFYFTVEETVDGAPVTRNFTATTSIVDYAEKVLSGDYTNADKVMVYYTLSYAYDAAYYAGDSDNLDAINPILNYYEVIGNMYEINDTYNPINFGLETVFDTAAVRISETPAFIIKVKEGFIGTITVSYDDGAVVNTYDKFATNAAEADDRTIVIENMRAYNFGTTLTFTVEGTIGGESVSANGQFNLDAYAQYAYDNSLEHHDLVYSLRAYAEVAREYKSGRLATATETFGSMTVIPPEFIYTGYAGKEIKVLFDMDGIGIGDVTFESSDERVTITDGIIRANGVFDGETVVTVKASSPYHTTTFDITVKTFTPKPNTSLINSVASQYENGILTTAKKGGTVFIGDSYCTLGYWKDFYEDFADEDAYLLGIGGAKVDDWLVCSERLFYALEPSEIIMHIGFNDVYNPAAYLAPEQLGELIIELLSIYHEKFPEADIYYCSIESSKWSNNYEKSFNESVISNAIVSAFADEVDWLTYVNTRPIFCNDETKEVYQDGDGNSTDDDDTGVYGVGSHPSVISYDEYKKIIDAARGKTESEEE